MERKKYYILIIIILLISNAISAFLLFSNPRNGMHKNEGPREYIIEKLDLNSDQVQQYDSLIEWHRSSVRNAEEHLFSLKSLLYSSIDKNNDSVDSIINAINSIHNDIEKIHVQHFRDIEKICTAEQKDKFKSLSLELSSLFKPKRP